ncbi:MAG: response regulator [bacterium]|nr:response regulator [bacterium]
MPVRKIKIALIEDSQTVRFFYKSVFEKAGFEVFEAENATAGWDVICERRPDIIVLDMMMPKIPGIELLKRIRSVAFCQDTPVLVLSAVKDQDKVQEIIHSGANQYVLKGMDSPELIREQVYKLLKEKAEKKVIQKLNGEDTGESKEEAGDPGMDRLFWWH